MQPPRPPEIVFRFILKMAALVLCASCCHGAFAAADLMITGKVSDSAGKPIADATVMVYHAGPTTGYSLFCPSCYADCGKRAITDSNGMFSFHHLSPSLWFELLVARSGYEPKFVEKVVPGADVPVTATLDVRPEISDPNRTFRGRIVDSNGITQRDVVVEPVGALWDAKTGAAGYGTIPGLDPIAVTDARGDFEIDFFSARAGPVKILVSVEARAKAETFTVLPAGREPQAITVSEGATIRGRLVQDGAPVGGAEIGLSGRPGGGYGRNLKVIGNPADEIRIGTQTDGTFAITNVPPAKDWYIYAKMESIAGRGASGALECATKHDKEIVDVGDLQIKAAYRLRGRVVLSDGKVISDGMRVTISSEKSPKDSQTVMLSTDGRFEFGGLAAGSYNIFASVRGYSPPPMAPVSFKDKDGRVLTYTPPPPPVSIEHDVDNFVIKLDPDGSASAKPVAASKPAQR